MVLSCFVDIFWPLQFMCVAGWTIRYLLSRSCLKPKGQRNRQRGPRTRTESSGLACAPGLGSTGKPSGPLGQAAGGRGSAEVGAGRRCLRRWCCWRRRSSGLALRSAGRFPDPKTRRTGLEDRSLTVPVPALLLCPWCLRGPEAEREGEPEPPPEARRTPPRQRAAEAGAAAQESRRLPGLNRARGALETDSTRGVLVASRDRALCSHPESDSLMFLGKKFLENLLNTLTKSAVKSRQTQRACHYIATALPSVSFSSVSSGQWLSRVRLFASPWIANSPYRVFYRRALRWQLGVRAWGTRGPRAQEPHTAPCRLQSPGWGGPRWEREVEHHSKCQCRRFH